MLKIKFLFWIIILSLSAWVGKKGYYYFFNHSTPIAIISGIEDSGFYNGDVMCSINGEHPYKINTISICLDNKPLVYNYYVGKASFEYPFTLNTRTMSNGKHQIDVKLTSGTFHSNEIHILYDIFIDNIPLQAAFVQQSTDVKVFQGKTLHIQFQTNKPLKEVTAQLLSKKYTCFNESKDSLIYEVFIPIACEEKSNEYILSINCIDYVDNEVTLEEKIQIVPFPFKKQTITVDAQKMKDEKETSQSQETLNETIKELIEKSPKEKLWTGNFCAPTNITATFTDFGTLRTTPDRGMYAHKGIDVGSIPKAGVWAPQDGIIIIKDRYLFSGNTIVIDHGWGIFSLLFHLEDFAQNLEIGQKIKRGNPLGRVGKTGYANGYHLHWEMRINNIEVDPMQWIKENF